MAVKYGIFPIEQLQAFLAVCLKKYYLVEFIKICFVIGHQTSFICCTCYEKLPSPILSNSCYGCTAAYHGPLWSLVSFYLSAPGYHNFFSSVTRAVASSADLSSRKWRALERKSLSSVLDSSGSTRPPRKGKFHSNPLTTSVCFSFKLVHGEL